MPQLINIQGYGVVSFPDDMTKEQIASAIENEQLPEKKPFRPDYTPTEALGHAWERSKMQLGSAFGDVIPAAIGSAFGFEDYAKKQMGEAASKTKTSMAAVLGGEREVVLAHLAKLNLTAANENGGGQIVAAGSLANLAKLTENPPAGSRVRPLAVSGAFHTKTMAPAVPVLSEMAKSISISDAKIPTLSNKDGAVLSSGQEVIERIVGQIAGPVRWDLCMQIGRAHV